MASIVDLSQSVLSTVFRAYTEQGRQQRRASVAKSARNRSTGSGVIDSLIALRSYRIEPSQLHLPVGPDWRNRASGKARLFRVLAERRAVTQTHSAVPAANCARVWANVSGRKFPFPGMLSLGHSPQRKCLPKAVPTTGAAPADAKKTDRARDEFALPPR